MTLHKIASLAKLFEQKYFTKSAQTVDVKTAAKDLLAKISREKSSNPLSVPHNGTQVNPSTTVLNYISVGKFSSIDEDLLNWAYMDMRANHKVYYKEFDSLIKSCNLQKTAGVLGLGESEIQNFPSYAASLKEQMLAYEEDSGKKEELDSKKYAGKYIRPAIQVLTLISKGERPTDENLINHSINNVNNDYRKFYGQYLQLLKQMGLQRNV